MKLKDGFLLRRVADSNVAVPMGPDLDQNLMITVNDTGAFLWKLLESETDERTLEEALKTEYGVDDATARMSVERFIGKLRGYGFLEA